jgi:hypothetical protein
VAGEYLCQATNAVGTVQGLVFSVRVAEAVPVVHSAGGVRVR